MKRIELTGPLAWTEIYDNEKDITAGVKRASYMPVTSLKQLSEQVNVEDAHPFDSGQYEEWTRYYIEQYPGCYDVELISGISYHIENDGVRFDLFEYLNQIKDGIDSPDIWLVPLLEKDEKVDTPRFYDTLRSVISAIYVGHEIDQPNLSELIV